MSDEHLRERIAAAEEDRDVALGRRVVSTNVEVAEAVARHNVRNRKMTGVLTASALLGELDRLRKIEEAAAEFVHTGGTWSHNELVRALDGGT